jgi:hypothetical protein
MVGKLRVRRPRHVIDVCSRVDNQHGVNALSASVPTVTPTTAESRTPAALSSTRSTSSEHVEALGRDDHFLLRPATNQLPVGAELPDVAAVWNQLPSNARAVSAAR